MDILRMLDPVALQCAEIVAIAKLGEQLLEDRPVSLAARNSEFAIEVALDVVLDAIVIQQGIVHIDEKNDGVRCRHDRFREHIQMAFEKNSVCRPLKKSSEARRTKIDERRRTLLVR